MMPLLNRMLIALLVAAMLLPFPKTIAHAQQPQGQSQGIAAIVNDNVISVHDLDSRLMLVLVTSNLQDTPENRRRLAPDVLRTLVDDALKRQEMRKQNITVSQADLDHALAQVAQQLRLQPTDLAPFLAQRGVGMATLIDQLETEIGWQRVITRLAGDRAIVPPREVDEELARTRRGTEYRLAEIFLPIDDPAEQSRVEELAVRLVAEARSGANFPALARSFSQGPSASNGGDLGWVAAEDLDEQTATVVTRLQPGEVSDAFRAQGGYFVLFLAGRRAGSSATKVVMALQQMFLPLPKTAPEADVSTMVRTAQQVAQGGGTCPEVATRAQQAGAQISSTPGMIDIQQLPVEFRQLLSPLAAGGITQPVRTPEGVLMVMVCDRREEAVAEEQRTAVERRLRDQRLSAVSRRQLRDLRRSALLDVRM